jgi:anti-sigma factor RsiW
MIDTRDHCTDELLYRYIDGGIADSDRSDIEDHLADCSRCRERHVVLARFDRMLRRMPLASVGPRFTQTVLAAVGIQPRDSTTYRVFEYAAGIFGMLLVAALTVAVLAIRGVFDQLPGMEASSTGTQVIGTIGSAITQLSADMGMSLREFFPYLFSTNALWTGFSTIAVLLLLAILDRAKERTVATKGR